MKKYINDNIDFVIAFILIIITLLITKQVLTKNIISIDMFFYKFIVNNIRNKYLTYFMKFVTVMGSSKVIILIIISLIIFLKNKNIAFFITLNPIINTLLNLILKNIVARKRPTEFFLIIEKGFSFPSGHSMVSVAFYGLLIYFLIKYWYNNKKYIIITILLLLIPLIMFSRIYLGVHYLSDVIAGGLISIVYLIIYIRIINRYLRKEEVDENKKYL